MFTLNDAGTEYSVTGYEGDEAQVIIPNTYENLPVTGIAARAFDGCNEVMTITIPKSVTVIGEEAFAGCDRLKSITLLSANVAINDSESEIADAVTIHGYNASTAHIYAGKYGKTFVNMGTQGLVFTLDSSRSSCKVTGYFGTDVHVVIPETYQGLPVTHVVKGALTGNQSSGKDPVVLPPIPLGMQEVDVTPSAPTSSSTTNTIQSVTLLSKTVTLEGSGTTIPLKAVIYGYIGSTAQRYATRYSRTFVALDDLVFTQNTDTPTYMLTNYERKTAEVVVIPDVYLGLPVTGIGENAFSGCTVLVDVTIPESVTSIGNQAFYGCRKLTSLIIPNAVTSIGDRAFDGCVELTSIDIPAAVMSVGENAFFGCKAVTSITVDADNEVYHSAGNCLIETASKTLLVGCSASVIPTDGSVTVIASGAFYGCSPLTDITIPAAVTSVGEGAFSGCTGLFSVTFLSADVEIFDDASTISDTAIIYGYEGSTAQAYAEKYNREFETLLPYTPGNLDGDDVVTKDDAIYLLKHTFNSDRYTVNQDCDFDGDGVVTKDDAIYLLKHTFNPSRYPIS